MIAATCGLNYCGPSGKGNACWPKRAIRPRRYSIHVNGPWCITFEWRDGRALRVDLEQYH
jgi:plasmid maintenance system killer protein